MGDAGRHTFHDVLDAGQIRKDVQMILWPPSLLHARICVLSQSVSVVQVKTPQARGVAAAFRIPAGSQDVSATVIGGTSPLPLPGVQEVPGVMATCVCVAEYLRTECSEGWSKCRRSWKYVAAGHWHWGTGTAGSFERGGRMRANRPN